MSFSMRAIQSAMLLFGVTFGSSSSADVEQDALSLIADFADRICTKIPLEGSKENLRLSGEAQAELSSFMKYLADIGVEGAAEYNGVSYQGLIREDIVNALTTSTNCKLQIWNDLKKRVLTGGSTDSPAAFRGAKEGVTLSLGDIHPIMNGQVEIVVIKMYNSITGRGENISKAHISVRIPKFRDYSFRGVRKGNTRTFEHRGKEYRLHMKDIDLYEETASLNITGPF